MSSTAHLIDCLVARYGFALKLAEASEILRMDEDKLVRLTNDGRFPYFEVCEGDAKRTTRRVLVSSLVEWMEAGGTAQYRANTASSASDGKQSRRIRSRSAIDAERRRRAALLAV